ncbi:MAG: LLM class flavin-dependent oxidoreductase [Gordonia sp. (in: high G+C Gram-positive bacteria)]
MRIGVFILPDRPWAEVRPQWERAEELGFDHAWTFDHLVWGGLPNSQWFSCVPTLTAAATVTEKIGLGSFVISPNFRHPVSLSREVESLIDVSGGRFLAGLGVGGSPDDGVLGQEPLPVRQRVDRFQEFVTLLDAALRDDHLTFDGEYYRARDMRLAKGAVRDRVPLILAANGPRSVRFAGRAGDGWVTTGTHADTVDEWFDGVARNCRTLDEALVQRADPPADFRRYLSLSMCPESPIESPAAFDDAAGRAAELGFTDVMLGWPRDTEPYRGSERVLEQIAAAHLS